MAQKRTTKKKRISKAELDAIAEDVAQHLARVLEHKEKVAGLENRLATLAMRITEYELLLRHLRRKAQTEIDPIHASQVAFMFEDASQAISKQIKEHRELTTEVSEFKSMILTMEQKLVKIKSYYSQYLALSGAQKNA